MSESARGLQRRRTEVIFKRLTIDWKEYVLILFIQQVGNCTDLTTFITLLIIYGGIQFFGLYTISYILLGTPLFSLCLFLGKYNQCGFIKFWNISPIFKGVAYSTIILLMMNNASNSVLSGYSLIYAVRMVQMKPPWFNCSFPGASKDCFEIDIDRRDYYNGQVCCPSNVRRDRLCFLEPNVSVGYTIPLATLDYYRNILSKLHASEQHFSGHGSLNYDNVMANCAVWVVVFIGSSLGFAKVRGIIYRTTIFGICVIITCFMLMFFADLRQGPKEFTGVKLDVTNPHMWGRINQLVFQRTLPGVIINLGAYAPEISTANINALLGSLLYLAMLLIFSIWINTYISYIRYHYTHIYVYCLTTNGFEVLYAIFPDLLTKLLPWPMFFTFLYYVSLLCFCISNMVISISCILDSIIDLNNYFLKFRFHICFLICSMCAVFSLIFLTSFARYIRETWFGFMDRLIITSVMTIFLITVFWIYGVDQIVTDIGFLYNQDMSLNIWVYCWRFLPFVVLIQFVYVCTEFQFMVDFIIFTSFIKGIYFAMLVLILIPIPIGAVLVYLRFIGKYEKHDLPKIFKPTMAWGPSDKELRRLRQHHNPTKEIRYKSENYQCKHKCLFKSKRLQREIERLEANRVLYQENMEAKMSAQTKQNKNKYID